MKWFWSRWCCKLFSSLSFFTLNLLAVMIIKLWKKDQGQHRKWKRNTECEEQQQRPSHWIVSSVLSVHPKKKKKRKAWRDGGILKLPAGRTQTRPLGWWNKVERNKHTQNQNQKPAADYCWRARRQEATDSVLSGTKPKCKLAWGLVLQVTASHRCGLVSSLCHMCLSPFRCSLQVSACWLRFSGPWCQRWFRVIRMPLYHRPYAHSYKWFCFS